MEHDVPGVADPADGFDEESDYFFRFSPEAYTVGIDTLLYALTH